MSNRCPFIEGAFADTAYAGKRVADATSIAVEIVRKPPDQVGFAVHPKRWIVERLARTRSQTGKGL